MMNKTLDILDVYKNRQVPLVNTNVSKNYIKQQWEEKFQEMGVIHEEREYYPFEVNYPKSETS